MTYPKDIVNACVKMLRDGITRQSVAVILSTRYNGEYTEDDVAAMIEQYKAGIDHQTQENAMSKALMLMANRKKLNLLLLTVLVVFLAIIAGLIVLGIYVTWIPLIVFSILFVAFIVFEILWTVRSLRNPPTSGGDVS